MTSCKELDRYYDLIMRLYKNTGSPARVTKLLNRRGINFSYNTIQNYIYKNKNTNLDDPVVRILRAEKKNIKYLYFKQKLHVSQIGLELGLLKYKDLIKLEYFIKTEISQTQF